MNCTKMIGLEYGKRLFGKAESVVEYMAGIPLKSPSAITGLIVEDGKITFSYKD